MASTLKVDTITTPDGTGDITFSRPIVGNLTAQKNVIINGDFDIWQRGTSITGASANDIAADRWRFSTNGTMVHDMSRSTDVPTVAESGHLSKYSLLIDCTTIDSSIAAGDYTLIKQVVEGYNFKYLAQKAMTLSFWHKHTKTGTYSITMRNGGSDRTYVANYTQSVTDTWEKATINISASPSGGTWDYTNGTGISIFWSMATGSTFAGTAGSWNTGNYFGSTDQVNACDSTSNNFMIAQVQLEAGSVATDFEIRDYATELAMCQRYYQKSYPYGTDPGTVNNTGCGIFGINGIASAAHYVEIQCNLHTTMRTTPTATVYSTMSPADSGKMNINGTNVTGAAINVGEHAFGAYGFSPTATSIDAEVHWTASAEL